MPKEASKRQIQFSLSCLSVSDEENKFNIFGTRMMMMPKYLQSYLNMAYHKMEEMKKEAGKISNVDLQKQIARIFYYLCVVSPIPYLSSLSVIAK
jgi:hypothetical protein